MWQYLRGIVDSGIREKTEDRPLEDWQYGPSGNAESVCMPGPARKLQWLPVGQRRKPGYYPVALRPETSTRVAPNSPPND